MMSYLWILLLGSLLAGSAKAQDEQDPAEDTSAPETAAPVADSAEEPAVDEESDHTGDELVPTGDEPEPTVDPEAGAHEPEAPEEGAAAVTPADAEPVNPGDDETAAPEVEITESFTPAADIEEDDATTTQGPGANPDAGQPSSSPEEPLIPEDKPEDKTTSTADPAVPDIVGEPTDPDTEGKTEGPVIEDNIVADVEKGVNANVPTVKVENPAPEVDIDLTDALPEDNVLDNGSHQGKGSRAHVAEATGDVDPPQAQEGSSSSLAGILCAVAVAVVGAVTGYITYQKKKLCFKEADPEAARKADAVEAQSDPQVLSNLLNSS